MEEKHFTPDIPPVTPETIIEDITRESVEEILGQHRSIWYIGVKEIKVFTVEDWQVQIWTDQRGQENIIFISKEYAGKSREVSWHIARRIAVKTMMKVIDQRDFIEKCVRKEVKPEQLK